MAYSTTANVRQEAGFTNNANVVDATINRHIAAADSRIDSVIVKLYTLPLSSTPAIIEMISRNLSAGYLLLEEYGTEAEGTTKDGNAKVKYAEAQLKMILEGLIPLVGSDGAELATSSSVQIKGFPNNTTGTDMTDQANKDDPPRVEIGMKF